MDDAALTKLRKWRNRAALLGIALALACNFAPDEYRELCRSVAQICTGVLP